MRQEKSCPFTFFLAPEGGGAGWINLAERVHFILVWNSSLRLHAQTEMRNRADFSHPLNLSSFILSVTRLKREQWWREGGGSSGVLQEKRALQGWKSPARFSNTTADPDLSTYGPSTVTGTPGATPQVKTLSLLFPKVIAGLCKGITWELQKIKMKK